MADKKSFILFTDRKEQINMLTDEQAGKLIKAVFEYVDTGTVTESDDFAVNLLFSIFKSQIDENAGKYKERCEKNRQIALERERKKRERNNTNVQEREQAYTKSTDTDTETETDTGTETGTEKDISLSDKSDGACSSSGTQKKEKFNKSQSESDFEECWSIYPKKQGKADARKAYLKFAKKDPDLKEKVISGIRNYIEDIQRNKTPEQYIKHGSTFFNGEHWNDDYSAKTGGMIETQPDSDTSEWDSIFEKL